MHPGIIQKGLCRILCLLRIDYVIKLKFEKKIKLFSDCSCRIYIFYSLTAIRSLESKMSVLPWFVCFFQAQMQRLHKSNRKIFSPRRLIQTKIPRTVFLHIFKRSPFIMLSLYTPASIFVLCYMFGNIIRTSDVWMCVLNSELFKRRSM